MIFLWPWWLMGLPVVAGVALWSLFRPGRRMLVVGSLRLWRAALAGLSPSGRRRSRRVTGGWLCLLAGAVAGVTAASGPVYYRQVPSRRVAVAVYPSAEIAAQPGPDNLRSAVWALLDRLDTGDRVKLLRPQLLGGASDWLSVAAARDALEALRPLPIPAAKLSMPPAAAAQRVYHFLPAGTNPPAGARLSVVEIPASLPPVTIEAFAARRLPGGKVQLLLAVRNQTTAVQRVAALRLVTYDESPSRRKETGSIAPFSLPAGGRRDFILSAAPAAGYAATCLAADAAPAPGGATYLAQRRATVARVAMIGPDAPLVRRYVNVDPSLQLVAGAEDADIVIANRVEAPKGKPALMIDPPSAPAGWRRRNQPLEAVELWKADIAADEAVMRHVDLSGVAVRRLRPWVASGAPAQGRLASYGGDALILRDESDAGDGAKRIYVAFDLAAENTNFPTTDAFVIFLANVMRYLAPAPVGPERYEFLTPMEAGPVEGLTALEVNTPRGPEASSVAWPGLYRDGSGQLHAVSLVALRGAEPNVPPDRAVAAAPLPAPRHHRKALELWPVLAVAALLFWLAGWTLRLR